MTAKYWKEKRERGENVFNVLERKIRRKLNHYYAEYEQGPEIHSLSQFVLESWNEMKEDERVKRENGELTMVDRLYLSMPTRIHQIRVRAGGRANYSCKIIS